MALLSLNLIGAPPRTPAPSLLRRSSRNRFVAAAAFAACVGRSSLSVNSSDSTVQRRLDARRARFRALAVWLLLGSSSAFGQATDEYDVKAAFLFNFTRFIEWPPEADPSTVRICIVGDDPFGTALDRMTRDRSVGGREIEVLRFGDAADAARCHVVFVRSEERRKAADLLQAVGRQPVLTVGENRDFAKMGGAVYLPTRSGRVGVVINTAAAREAGLRVSAKLLNLATIFEPDDRPGGAR